MPVLTSQQRKTLETLLQGPARAERPSRAALDLAGLTAERPPAHLDEDDRQLRRGLRAKRASLATRATTSTGSSPSVPTSNGTGCCSLASSRRTTLLIHPEYRRRSRSPTARSSPSHSASRTDGRSRLASPPRSFLGSSGSTIRACGCASRPRVDCALEGILDGLPAEMFAADDALGWVYQFWQKDKKDEVNASERKIGGADLGPVTQLFTENYMVRFLLENSLGAWWAARHPDSPLVTEFEYLRFDDDGTPAAGSFDGWPERVAEVTVMDPCCGSGHFLVEAFSMLWQMRAEEEGLAPVDAQDAVLRDNLFGLELDPRCVQIAMFAVAAARLEGRRRLARASRAEHRLLRTSR